MINGKLVLGIIPARKGSKRLKNKNILDLSGKPLIYYSIKASINSKYIDETFVSSDSQKILDISYSYGAKKIERPKSISNDEASSFSVLEHALRTLQDKYEYVCLLQPTSPLRSSKHIDEACELLIKKNADAVLSICACEHNPLWSNNLPEDLNLENFISTEVKDLPSQKLPQYYRLNGAIYLINVKQLMLSRSLFLENNSFGYFMDQQSSIDIDTNIDFQFAQFIHGSIKSNQIF
tara:strand:+ start:366 stop:1073 length:708 start_codon:yes stop_codon:yes gene_type:complete